MLQGSRSGAEGVARRADLRITRVAVPGAASNGERVRVPTTVRNAGKRKAASSIVRYYASFDGSLDGADIPLEGSLKVPEIGAGDAFKKAARVTMVDPVPVEDFLILACADDTKKVVESKEANNCGPSATTIVFTPAPSSLDLIERDLQAGEITADEAAILKMEASFGFPDPPARYQGADPEERLDAGPVKEIAETWASLSTDTQQQLDPYLSPPVYAGARMSVGWVPPAARSASPSSSEGGGTGFCYGGGREIGSVAAWDHIDTEHFRFWYYTVPDLDPGGLLEGFNGSPERSFFLAQTLAGIAEHVYATETDLFAREPISDASQPCNGGDGRIDVYAAKLSTQAAAQVVPYPPGGINRPGWMFISPDYANTATKARDVFAHEFAHVIQLAFDYADVANRLVDYAWLEEATSNWAIDLVYPDDNFEHQFAREYLNFYGFNNPLNVMAGYYHPGSGPNTNGYEDYLFLFFVTRKANNPLIMRSIWANTETMNSIRAVNEAIPGGFLEQWPEFAKYNMNRAPDDHYQDWDDLTWAFDLTGAKQPRVEVDLKGKSARNILMPGNSNRNLWQLSTEYTVFDFTDESVRRAVFKDYGFRDQDPADAIYQDVQAWIQLESGEVRVEEWTDGEDVSFCRDEPDENVGRVVILYSSGVPFDQAVESGHHEVFFPETQQAAVKASAACALGGTISYSFVDNYSNEDWNVQESGEATVDVKLVPTHDPDAFEGQGSTYTYSSTGHSEVYRHNEDGCLDEVADITEEGSGTLEDGNPSGYFSDDGSFWLSTPVMPTIHRMHNEVICAGGYDSEYETAATFYPCPQDAGSFGSFEFQPAGSGVYTIDCASQRTYVDGAGRTHDVTVNISGTLNIPH